MTYGALTAEGLLNRPLNEVESKHAPQNLFVAGDPQIMEYRARVSIVGSRKASPDGLKRARHLSRLLCERDVVVVSGLAEGIDTAAHTVALDQGGKTVAVLGTPLDKFYPSSNAGLQRRLMDEQLVVSQFPIGSPIRRGNFPMRNRTMALISDATVIIEAGETSGSLSQGWEALRLGRPLFIAKSVADDKSLAWPGKMLGYGAMILSTEMLDEFFAMLPERHPSESSGAPAF
jgi:DNA processing protein